MRKRSGLFYGVYLFLAAFAALSAASVMADDAGVPKEPVSLSDAAYFTPGEVALEEVTDLVALDDVPAPAPAPAPEDELDEVEAILDQIIRIGSKVWAVVEKNKPVVDYQNQVASALPEGVTHWLQLQDWQTPKARVFRVTYKNLYGVRVVDFAFRVLYTYGGSVQGKGRYLTHVTVVPHTLDVAWGYRFNAQASVPSVVNAGTAEAPVAGMELLVQWKVDTILVHREASASYFVRGDGAFQDLTEGTRR